jgi:hypothetical protein
MSDQKPVASLMTNINSGDVKLVWNDEAFDRALWRETPLYTSPPRTALREAARQALKALEYYRSGEDYHPTPASEAISSIQAALSAHPTAAPTEPAPGWCKHCRQYTIEEPLQAAPIKTLADSFCDLRCADEHAPGCVRAAPTVVAPVPIAYMHEGWGPDCGPYIEFREHSDISPVDLSHWTPLYLAAPPRTALTDEQILAIGRELGVRCKLGGNPNIDFDYARAIEAAHGIGGPRNE